ELIVENRTLRQQIPQGPSGGGQTEDKDIVKRWLGVLLVTKGCMPWEPELYVRWEGKVVSFQTGQPMPDALEFDASDVIANETIFVGHKYFDVGDGTDSGPIVDAVLQPRNGAGLEALNKNGLHTKLFYGVSRGSGSWSIYTGLRDPRAQADKD